MKKENKMMEIQRSKKKYHVESSKTGMKLVHRSFPNLLLGSYGTHASVWSLFKFESMELARPFITNQWRHHTAFTFYSHIPIVGTSIAPLHRPPPPRSLSFSIAMSVQSRPSHRPFLGETKQDHAQRESYWDRPWDYSEWVEDDASGKSESVVSRARLPVAFEEDFLSIVKIDKEKHRKNKKK